MCGYFGNLHECPAVIDLMNELGMPLPYPLHRVNPSFGGTCFAKGLVTMEGDDYIVADAVWWCDRDRPSDTFTPNKYTTFNAGKLGNL